MKTRTHRLLAIRRIIEGHSIGSQVELLERLEDAGFKLTQATLSRDLKFLQAVKIPDKRLGYVYILTGSANGKEAAITGGNFPLNGFVSMEFAWNMAVIKTRPGYANSIASAIDELGAFEILGTVAGDDTILLIPREGVGLEDVKNVLAVLIPVE